MCNFFYSYSTLIWYGVKALLKFYDEDFFKFHVYKNKTVDLTEHILTEYNNTYWLNPNFVIEWNKITI